MDESGQVKKRLAEIAGDEPDSVLVLATHAALREFVGEITRRNSGEDAACPTLQYWRDQFALTMASGD